MESLKAILLAEDNPLDVELTLKALAANNLANHVEVVNDGEAALDYLFCRGKYQVRPRGNPTVILLDIKMPKIDGIEVLKAIKSDKDLKSIPVVILTSSKEDKDLLESYVLGVNAYVVKPLNFKDFMESVGNLGVFWALINEPPPGSVKTKAK